MNQLILFPNEGYDFFMKSIYPAMTQKTPWQQTRQVMYDKTVLTPRLVAWYGDHTAFKLGNKAIDANPWLFELAELRKRIEKQFGHHFNSVLLNLYRNHHDSVS